jgi:hypothetical protein
MILYVSQRCASAPRFGKIKLNKILWKADFEAYARRGRPVTGRPYQRLENGPAPTEMAPLLTEMVEEDEIQIDMLDVGAFVEERPRAKRVADLSLFDRDDMEFVETAIQHYWYMTGTEASDDSHGLAWKTRKDGDRMPYESAYLSDEKTPETVLRKMEQYAERLDIKSH